MKVSILNPNYEGSLESKRAYIPINLAYIAGYLRERGVDVDVIEAAAFDLNDEELERELKRRGTDVLTVGAMSDVLPDAIKACGVAKKLGITTVLGGYHASVLPRETMAWKEVDIAVIGEGEEATYDVVDALESGRGLDTVKGIVYRNNGNGDILMTQPREWIADLDSLPFPARDMFPLELYDSFTSIVQRTPSGHMMTARGCPFGCTFCASKSFWKRTIRERSPENVVDEMEELKYKYGYNEIYIWDDTFNLNVSRAEAICDEIVKRGLDISLRAQLRVVPLTEQLLRKMKRAGFWNLYFGVETGDPVIMKNLRKAITLQHVEDAFRLCKKVGMRTLAFFMISHPGETKEQMMNTLKFAIKIDPDFVNFTISAIYPGTELYEHAVKEGLIKRPGPGEFFRPDYYVEKGFTRKEIEDMQRYISRKFYMRPSYMIKRLFKIKTLDEFKANMQSGTSIITNLLGSKNPFVVGKKWISYSSGGD